MLSTPHAFPYVRCATMFLRPQGRAEVAYLTYRLPVAYPSEPTAIRLDALCYISRSQCFLDAGLG